MYQGICSLIYGVLDHTLCCTCCTMLYCAVKLIRPYPPPPLPQPALLALFEKYKDSKGKQAKLKTPAQLQVSMPSDLA